MRNQLQNLESLSNHERAVRSLAASLLRGREADIDDVTQDVWLKVLGSKQKIEPVKNSWFRKIALNRIREIDRADKSRQRRESLRESALAPATDQLIEKAELHRALVQALLNLKQPYRRCLLLRFFEGYTASKIAHLDEVPLATVRTWIRRGLIELSKELKADNGEDWNANCCVILGIYPLVNSKALLGSILVSAKSNLALMIGLVVALSVAVFFAFQFTDQNDNAESFGATDIHASTPVVSRHTQALKAKDKNSSQTSEPNQGAANHDAATDLVLDSQIVFVSVPRTTKAKVKVSLSSVSDKNSMPQELHFQNNERARIPSGKWNISTSTEGWRVEPSSIEATAHEAVTVWLIKGCHIRLRCIDENGSAIPKAEVTWITTESAGGKRTKIESGILTDEDGRTSFKTREPVGTLQMKCAGYRIETLHILSDPQDEITVVLDKRQTTDHSILVLDAETRQPIKNASLTKSYTLGQSGSKSDEEGRLYIDDHVGFGRGFLLQAKGYFPLTCGPRELANTNTVSLYPASFVSFNVRDSQGQELPGATVFLTSISDKGLAASLLWAEKSETNKQGQTRLLLPRGLVAQVVAELADGRSGKVEVGPELKNATINIVVEKGATLLVNTLDHLGNAVPNAVVEAQWKGRGSGATRRFIGNEAGQVYVSDPKNLYCLEVSAKGLPPIKLERDPRSDIFPGGELEIEFSKPHTLNGRLVSNTAEPIAGLNIGIWFGNRISTREIHERTRQRTSHPAWVHQFPRPVSAVSGPDGRFEINGLPKGKLQLTTALPRILDPDRKSSHDSTLIEVILPLLGEQEFVVTELRLLSVKVLAADTLIPIKDFRIQRKPQSLSRADVHNRGRWEGWIPATTESLEIFAAGYQPREIVLSKSSDESRHRVKLQRAEPQGIVFEGNNKPSPGQGLRIFILKGQHHKGEYHEYISWQGTFVVEDASSTPLSVPFPRGSKISLQPFKKDGVRYKFSPSTFNFEPGTQISLSVFQDK